MSQLPATDQQASSAEQDHARVREMIESPAMQARLEAARAQRERVLAQREAAKRSPGAEADPADPAPVHRPDPELGPGRGPDPEGVLLDSARLRMRIEAAQAGREGLGPTRRAPAAQAAGPADRRDDVVTAPQVDWPARPRPAAAEAPASPARRRPWPASAVLGLLVGLALGAGLMRLVEVAAPAAPGATAAAGLADAPARPATDPVGPPALAPPAHPADGLRVAAASADRPPLRRGREALVPPRPGDGDGDGDGGGVEVDAATAPAADHRLESPGPPGTEAVDLALASDVEASAASRPPLLRLGARPADHDPPPAGQAPATPDLPARVSLHVAALPSPATVRATRSAMEAMGLRLAGVVAARFNVAESEVRYFHEADARDAARIAAAMGAAPRDFSAFRPAPPPGTLEVWLAQGG